MIRNYQFNAGTVSIPVPAENRPSLTPETTSVVMDFGTYDLSILNPPTGCPSTIQIALGEMPVPISDEEYPASINVPFNTRTVRYDDGVPEPATPNWPGFRLAMMQSPAFLRIANASAPLFVMLNSVMWLIAIDPTKLQETALIWNQLATIAQPTESEISALNAIAATNQIPLQLNESGMIE